MVELVSLVMGGLGLASLFNTCVYYFKNVKIGMQASSDFQTTVVEIGVLQRRFTRWGQAVNVNVPEKPREESDEKLLAGLKNQIRDIFARAENVSQQTANGDEIAVYDITDDLELRPRNLVTKLRDIAKSRESKTS
ncbi:hypothetical protein OEA41_007571 [Lepraria neglecta]|uniref:Prion-inhibition and propagation HeLo domain-containing protein n=1 Tax=Lepraria neglecta TaxID=209136 RepID=A0AAE0DN25_9LECA|nr:hypothetical protein OEA41_007571 [Lepraria neglecta]